MPTALLPSLSQIPQVVLLERATQSCALDLAKQVLGKKHEKKISALVHPDLHLYQLDEKSGLHSIESMRKLIAEMALPPFEAKSKVFIIEDAEKMLIPSANCLLKTLEEPYADSYIFLLCDEPKKLLPTILSRLTPITFSKEEITPLDLSNLFELAQKGLWDRVLDELPKLEGEDPNRVFAGVLAWVHAQKNAPLYETVMRLVSEGQEALERNIRLQTIVCNLLLHVCS